MLTFPTVSFLDQMTHLHNYCTLSHTLAHSSQHEDKVYAKLRQAVVDVGLLAHVALHFRSCSYYVC